MKKIQLLVLMLFMIFSVQSQVLPPKQELHKHNIGAFVGGSSGYGLSYRYFAEKVGVQVTALPIASNSSSHISIGGEFLYSFHRSYKTNIYGYMGYHHNIQNSDEEYDYFEIISPFNDNYSIYKSDVNYASVTGIGAGFELIAGNRVSFNWQLGYGFAYLNGIEEDLWKTTVDLAFGIYFKF